MHWTLHLKIARTIDWTNASAKRNVLRATAKSKRDERWLKAFGAHLRKLIRENGYRSPYQFWIERAGDHISRANLNYIVTGRFDPKLTTVRLLARLLNVNWPKLFEFEKRR